MVCEDDTCPATMPNSAASFWDSTPREIDFTPSYIRFGVRLVAFISFVLFIALGSVQFFVRDTSLGMIVLGFMVTWVVLGCRIERISP
jgi:hypothetical protein